MKTEIPSHIEDYLRKEVYPNAPKPSDHKPLFNMLTTLLMVIGLLLTSSEQASFIPNICGIVLMLVGVVIYKKLNK